MLLKKCPIDDTCHHSDPKNASTTPLSTTQNSAAIVTTPNTYTQEPMYAGCLVGSSSVIGSVFSTRRRTDAVHPVSGSATGSGAVAAVCSTVPGVLSLLIMRLLPPVRRERCDERQHEEQHHHADEDEVRQRDEDEAPMNVWSGRVH